MRLMPEDRPDGAGLGEVLRQLLGDRGMRRGVALGRLTREWERVVGPKLAAETAPVGLDDGGLVVAATSSAWAAQLQFLSREVGRRANEVLGRDEVRGVRVVVQKRRSGG